MATHDEQTFLQRFLSLGEERMNKILEELMSNPRFAEALGKAVQTALETKGRVDRNIQTVLSLLNLPSKSDYRKLATKIEALQGSLVNLNLKLDRILAAQQAKPAATVTPMTAPRPAKRRPKPLKPQNPDDPVTV
jgi:polyhydroxyalkanoate synthesis regulator phasin